MSAQEKQDKDRIRRSRARDIRYQFGWFAIGVVLVIIDIVLTQMGIDSGFGLGFSWARLLYLGLVFCVIGAILTLWAYIRPRK